MKNFLQLYKKLTPEMGDAINRLFEFRIKSAMSFHFWRMRAFYYSSASELNIACHFTIACGVALLVELHIFLFNQFQ